MTKILIFTAAFIIWPLFLGLAAQQAAGIPALFAKESSRLFRCGLGLLLGTVLQGAVFQLLAVPMILAKAPFHLLTGAWIAVLAGLSLALPAAARMRKKAEVPGPARNSCGRLRPVTAGIYLCAAVLILFQCSQYARGMHIDDDDSRFIASAVSAYQHDTMLLENPATGEETPRPEGELVKDVTSPWCIYLAAMAAVIHVHPAILAHVLIPVWLLLLACLQAWIAGAILLGAGDATDGFPAEERYAWFLLFYVTAVQFYGGSIYTRGAFTLVRLWQGKAAMETLMIPWLLLFSFGLDYAHHKAGREESRGCAAQALLLAAGCLYACLMSGVGMIAAGTILLLYALWRWIRCRNAAAVVRYGMCVLPAVLYSGLYAFLK